jgi:hypothetical protein
MNKIKFKNLSIMLKYIKQKQTLDKNIRDYIHREKYKYEDNFNKAIVEYKKPYSDIAVVNKNIIN